MAFAGDWTTVRNEVLGNANLSRVGFDNGLDRCIILNPGTVAVSRAMMATTVEAILGAVHLEGEDEALSMVMDNLDLTHHLLTVTLNLLLPLICSVLYVRTKSIHLGSLTRSHPGAATPRV